MRQGAIFTIDQSKLPVDYPIVEIKGLSQGEVNAVKIATLVRRLDCC